MRKQRPMIVFFGGPTYQTAKYIKGISAYRTTSASIGIYMPNQLLCFIPAKYQTKLLWIVDVPETRMMALKWTVSGLAATVHEIQGIGRHWPRGRGAWRESRQGLKQNGGGASQYQVLAPFYALLCFRQHKRRLLKVQAPHAHQISVLRILREILWSRFSIAWSRVGNLA